MTPFRVFATSLLVSVLQLTAWSIATPLFGPSDEETHAAHAVARLRRDRRTDRQELAPSPVVHIAPTALSASQIPRDGIKWAGR